MPSDTNCFATCGQADGPFFDMRAYNEVAKYGSGKAVETETDGLTSCVFPSRGRLSFGTSDGSLLAFDVLSEKSIAACGRRTARKTGLRGCQSTRRSPLYGSWDTFVKILIF
jgi:hypothetical protein